MKKRVIKTCVIVFILALIAILFSAVFRLRHVNVRAVGEFTPPSEEIINSANVKYGSSIFKLDKDAVINRIEHDHTWLKVVQVKTTSPVSVEIVVRQRIAMYKAEYDNKIYIFDEDLKVLGILEAGESEPEYDNLINILDPNNSLLNLSADTFVADFVGSNFVRGVVYNLFVSMYESVTVPDGDSFNYLDRAKICELVDSVQFESARNTMILNLNETALNSLYSIDYPVEVVICEPNKSLNNKVRICFGSIAEIPNPESKSLVITYTDKAGYSFK